MTVDVAALGAWLAARGVMDREVTLTTLPGGHSNLTHRVTDTDGRTAVLRRPPPGPLEQGAHDVVREGALLRALAPGPVPVPDVLGAEPDPDVLGTPFLVMAEVPGTVVRTTAVAAALGPVAVAAAHDHVAVLARLHGLDPLALDLPEDLHRRAARGGHVLRLLDRWGEQVPRARAEHREPLARALAALRATVPDEVPPRLLHGDYRLDNVVIDPTTGNVRAVLDWELATVGDPRTDLGSLLAVWTTAADGFVTLPDPPSRAPGMPDVAALLADYASAAGGVPADVPWFVALACWKFACIVEGVHRRRSAGAPAHGADPGELTGPLTRRALALLA